VAASTDKIKAVSDDRAPKDYVWLVNKMMMLMMLLLLVCYRAHLLPKKSRERRWEWESTWPYCCTASSREAAAAAGKGTQETSLCQDREDWIIIVVAHQTRTTTHARDALAAGQARCRVPLYACTFARWEKRRHLVHFYTDGTAAVCCMQYVRTSNSY
jgi:hypothetical protein